MKPHGPRLVRWDMKKAMWAWMACAVICACDQQPVQPLAPTASALEPVKPKTSGAMKYPIASGSKIEFMMEAPIEKIRGRVENAISGDVFLDPTDLAKTTAHILVDIGGLELYQQVKKGDEFGPEEKKEKQNQHAREWLQIDAAAEGREKNKQAAFAIKEVVADPNDVTKMTGAERKVKLTVKGNFLLHGRKSEKTAKLEATFTFEGDKAVRVAIETVEPFTVNLAEHDVRPRDALGKTLDELAPKVAKDALVSLEFTASFEGMATKDERDASKATPFVEAPRDKEASAAPK